MNDRFVRIESMIGDLDSIPTLSNVVSRINREMQNPRTTADQIGKIISNDQSLTLAIMKLVNSAFYGFSKKINTISHAVAILGFNTIKNLIMTTSLLTSLKSSIQSPYFDQNQFWAHSLGVGTFAKVIGNTISFDKREELFLAGVIHDIGKIILISALTHDFEKAIIIAEQKEIMLIEAEEKVFGFNHCDVGFWIAEKWQLPNYLSHVILNHHSPEKSLDFHSISTIIQIADTLTRALDIGSGGDPYLQNITDDNWKSIQLPYDALPQLLVEGEKEFIKAKSFMQLL
ncbi:MAG: HDOD domain-containing protein [Fibrobacterales bacterium]